MASPQTAFSKFWQSHIVKDLGSDRALIYIDRHLVHEGTSRPGFDKLRQLGRGFRRPDLTFSAIEHGVSTMPGRTIDSWPLTAPRNRAMQQNCKDFGLELIDVNDPEQGIVHVIGPELGIVLPGTTVVCGDSHTGTCGGLGAWSWGVGASMAGQVMAAQTLLQQKPKTMRVTFTGTPGPHVYGKDMILYLIGKFGIGAGVGHIVEYAGPAISALSMEGRMTICNMSIEFGSRGGFVTADDSTFQYLHGRRYTPKGQLWDLMLKNRGDFVSDDEARFDTELAIDVNDIKPQITWGTSPQDVVPVDGRVPDPSREPDPARRKAMQQSIDYLALTPGAPIVGVPIDYAFIGSCTNSRLEDIQAAAAVARGRKVKPGIQALVVPGSMKVRDAAVALGLDKILTDAGSQWREPGCSMCVATNGDIVPPGKRCISTSNRNFESRQGPQSRTHLSSPAMVAAAAVSGHIADVRQF